MVCSSAENKSGVQLQYKADSRYVTMLKTNVLQAVKEVQKG